MKNYRITFLVDFPIFQEKHWTLKLCIFAKRWRFQNFTVKFFPLQKTQNHPKMWSWIDQSHRDLLRKKWIDKVYAKTKIWNLAKFLKIYEISYRNELKNCPQAGNAKRNVRFRQRAGWSGKSKNRKVKSKNFRKTKWKTTGVLNTARGALQSSENCSQHWIFARLSR